MVQCNPKSQRQPMVRKVAEIQIVTSLGGEGLEIGNIFRIYKAQLPFQKMIFQTRTD